MFRFLRTIWLQPNLVGRLLIRTVENGMRKEKNNGQKSLFPEIMKQTMI